MKKTVLTLSLICVISSLLAQDPKRFADEIAALKVRNQGIKVERPIVFAGSSSFRLWTTLQADLLNAEIVNNGFGGSQYSDLIYYIDPLILNLKPGKLYIYEGDNDLAEGENPDRVMEEAKLLFATIKSIIPDIQIYVLSAKPSPARWERKPSYSHLNMYMREYCEETEGIDYIDIWRPMLGPDGQPNPELYVEDGIHLTSKGYQIWIDKILPTLK